MIMTTISDETENVLSKEAKSAIFTSTQLTLQETITVRENVAQGLHIPMTKKAGKGTVSHFVTTKLQFYFVVADLELLSLYMRISFVSLSLSQPTHYMRIKCKQFQYNMEDRDKYSSATLPPHQFQLTRTK